MVGSSPPSCALCCLKRALFTENCIYLANFLVHRTNIVLLHQFKPCAKSCLIGPIYGKSYYLFRGMFQYIPRLSSLRRFSAPVQTMRAKLLKRFCLRKTVFSISANFLAHCTIFVLQKLFSTSSNHVRYVALRLFLRKTAFISRRFQNIAGISTFKKMFSICLKHAPQSIRTSGISCIFRKGFSTCSNYAHNFALKTLFTEKYFREVSANPSGFYEVPATFLNFARNDTERHCVQKTVTFSVQKPVTFRKAFALPAQSIHCL